MQGVYGTMSKGRCVSLSLIGGLRVSAHPIEARFFITLFFKSDQVIVMKVSNCRVQTTERTITVHTAQPLQATSL